MSVSENGLVMNMSGNHTCLSCSRAQIFDRDHWVAHKEMQPGEWWLFNGGNVMLRCILRTWFISNIRFSDTSTPFSINFLVIDDVLKKQSTRQSTTL
jgi:hypothetical protein